MARPAVLDQRSVLSFRAPSARERVYLKDLSKFLNCGTGRLRKWAKRNRIWHPGDVYREPEWVTAAGAMKIIAHIRAWQEQHYGRGQRPFHERQDYLRKYMPARREAKRIANLGAEADAEPQRGLADDSGAAGEAVAETPAVSDIRP